MKRRIVLHIVYWLVILCLLTLFFGSIWESHLLAFYFSILLLPVVIGTTYFFNLYLVPRYLITGKYRQFVLYFFYMLVVSLYFEILVSLLSFVVIAELNVEVLNLKGISIFILGVTLYLIVFATSFIRLVIQFQSKTKQIETLTEDRNRNDKDSITIRADRKNHLITLDDLIYIESLDDYIKVVTSSNELLTRERISKLHELLPDHFIRTHRSFVINTGKVRSYTQNEVILNGFNIPISRSYKKAVIDILGKLDLKEN